MAQVAHRLRKAKSRADCVVVFDRGKLPANFDVWTKIYHDLGATAVVTMDLAELWNATNNKELWQGVFVKLAAYRLVQYSRVIVVDSDLLMVQNCDDVFPRPHPAMSQWENPTSQNSGFWLLKPNMTVYKAMIRALERIPNNRTLREETSRRSANAPLGSPEQMAEGLLTDQYTEQGFLFAWLASDEALREGYGPLHLLPTIFNVYDAFYWFSKDNFKGSFTETFGWLFMLGPNRHHVRAVHLIGKPTKRMNNVTEEEGHKDEKNKLLEGYACLWWRSVQTSVQRLDLKALPQNSSSPSLEDLRIIKFKSDTCREEVLRLVEREEKR